MKIAGEGVQALKLFLVPAIVFYITGRRYGAGFIVLSGLFLFMALFCLFFFRDPERLCPADENVFLSPADGRIIEAGVINDRAVVKIFMSVFNVHVQRQPVTARVETVAHVPGLFKNALRKDAGDINEHHTAVFRTAGGTAFSVKQIAGLIARRIRFFYKAGDTVKQGERIGIIYFGSQVDLEISGADAELLVREGQKVTAGITPLARLRRRSG